MDHHLDGVALIEVKALTAVVAARPARGDQGRHPGDGQGRPALEHPA
jgi:hypothetical protein